MKTVLVADIGSSSVKAGLVSVDGSVVASVRVRFDASLSFPQCWLHALKTAFSQVLTMGAGYSLSEPPASLLISGAGPTLVSVDNAGRVSAFLLWDTPIPESVATDAEPAAGVSTAQISPAVPASGTSDATDDAPTAPDVIGESTAADAVGVSASPSPSIFLPRLLAFRTLFPAETAAARRVFSGPEFAVFCLSGGEATVLPEVRYAPAYWSADLLAAHGFSAELFPPFVPPGFCAGFFSPENPRTPYAAFFRGVLPEGIPVLAGPPDFVSALLGTATVFPGSACDRAGTSEGLNVCTDKPVFAEGLRTLPSPAPGLWNVSCLLPETGLAFRRFRASSPQYASLSYEELLREIADSPVSPVPGGTENPARVMAEKIGFLVRAGIEKLNAATGFRPAFTLSGGQAKNALWNQMKADICGTVFSVTQTADAELLGDAVIAFCASGDYASYAEACTAMVKISRRFVPDSAANAVYTRRFAESGVSSLPIPGMRDWLDAAGTEVSL